jgi:hypothetical protein
MSGVGLLLAALLAGSATSEGDSNVPIGPSPVALYSAPADYRLLVARAIAPKPGYRVLSATISKPTERWGGLLGGGFRPVVCATTTIEGRFMPLTTRWLVMFENGKVYGARAEPPAIYCLNVPEGPFPEVVKYANGPRR